MNVVRVAWIAAAILLSGFAVFEGVKHGSVAAGTLIAFGILPDLTLIGAFASPGRLRPGRVRAYNAVHLPWAPLALLATGMLVPLPALLGGISVSLAIFLAGLGWLAHVAVDRAAGFGPRAPDGMVRRPGARVLGRRGAGGREQARG